MTSTIDRTARRESPGESALDRFGEPIRPYRPLDAATRAQAVDMVRKAIGSAYVHLAPNETHYVFGRMTAPTLLRAVRSTADMLAHPADTAARAAALAIPSDGTMAKFPAPPDPFTIRNHETVSKRNRKRIATFERQHIGTAPVIGDRYEPVNGYRWGSPAVDPMPADVRQRLSMDLVALASHRLIDGADSLAVYRIAQHHLAPFGLEPLTGTDPTSWHRTGRIDRSDVVASSSHRALLDGLNYRSALNELAPFGGVFGTHTRQRTTWTTRGALRPVELRKGEPGEASPTLALRTAGRYVNIWSYYGRSAHGYLIKDDPAMPLEVRDTTLDQPWSVTTPAETRAPLAPQALGYGAIVVTTQALIAPSTVAHKLWRGHVLVTRPRKSRAVKAASKPSGRKARKAAKARNVARTDYEVTRPESHERGAWLPLVELVDPGKRVVIVGDEYRATVTRKAGKNGRYSANVRDHGERWTVTGRTADRIAHHLATRAS